MKPPKPITIKNHLSAESCIISPLTKKFSEKDLIDLVESCNQPLIYNNLFKQKFDGRPYQKNDALEFANIGIMGWKQQKEFIFIIRNSEGKIVGGMDIKSDPKTPAEIGYWADSNHSGFMTNAAKAMIDWAKDQNYTSLYALIVPQNTKSKSLVERLGFIYSGETKQRNKLYHKYTLTL